MIKRKLALICIAAMLACTTACGGDDKGNGDEKKTEKTENPGAPSAVEHKEKGYVFKYNGVNISVDVSADPVIEKLGEPKSYFEADSCAFQGKDKTYVYNGFEITTYEQEGKDYIASVYLKDDTVATPEGLSLFQKKEDMTKVYGDGYKENAGMYEYTKDRMKLLILIKNDEITSIQYVSDVLG